ncbi:sodium:solute symporter family protein [Desulfosporosinus metallidurans]|uniref:Putative sodium-solute symporter n=1 Tax=Desulfosporosinus metallidurans TaxID=1888891 RepID=A0A1Q8QWZ9_9FIRM|nr:sodium:solute symporter family protein [Desulfosporosinus metallidurans]OLN31825.1 putative sodium-solute symporter [Desulfosporosinus metallidurans]
MSSYGAWIIGLALVYTTILIILGNIVKKKATSGESYWVGGRNFKPWMVFVCITGLFSGSSFISIMELSYLKGISAGWYGIAEMVHVLIIAVVLIGTFRRRMMVTVSGMIGDTFGRLSMGIAGAITAFTFPMWSVATALSFASAVSAFTNIPITISVAFAAVLLLIYLQAGGMWSVVMTQTANTIMFFIMFIIGGIAVFINPGIEGLKHLAVINPSMYSPTNVGLQVIISWFATFIINVLLAQAAFQMALSCRTPEEGRKGMLMAFSANFLFVFFGVLFGLAAQVVLPGGAHGMVMIPKYLATVLPAPLVGLFFLGIWACALGWGASCQFSGATSLGRDVTGAINPSLSDNQKVTYTKWSLVVLTLIMIVLAFLRSDQAAWWNVFAWTLRNGATFAPVVAALFWPLGTKRAAAASLVLGFISGLSWYALGHWDPVKFYYNIHPVFFGMSVNMLAMVLVTLIEQAGKYKVGGSLTTVRKKAALIGALVGALALLSIAIGFNWLYTKGLFGLAFFLVVLGAFIMTLSLTTKVEEGIETSEESCVAK